MRCFVVVAVCFVASAAWADDVKVVVEKVPGSDTPVNVAELVIDAPAEAIWKIVSRCADYPTTMVKIAAAKELKRYGDEKVFTTVCQVTADLPFPLPDLTSVSKAVHNVEPGVKYTRTWTFVSGDYEINEGSWTLVVLDDQKTRVTYRLRARPKLAVPEGLLAVFTKDTLPAVMKNLQEKTKKK
jgi:hypothetical protein